MRLVTSIYMSVTLRSSDAALLTGSDDQELVRAARAERFRSGVGLTLHGVCRCCRRGGGPPTSAADASGRRRRQCGH